MARLSRQKSVPVASEATLLPKKSEFYALQFFFIEDMWLYSRYIRIGGKIYEMQTFVRHSSYIMYNAKYCFSFRMRRDSQGQDASAYPGLSATAASSASSSADRP
jgi:hypothetical protein